MHGRMKTFGCGAVGVLAWLSASSTGAHPVAGKYLDEDICDSHRMQMVVEELGDGAASDPSGPFLPGEAIISASLTTPQTACGIPPDGGIGDWEVSITNTTGRTFTALYFVADAANTVGNRDGTINGAHAFRIDSVGINQPLIFESMLPNDVFEPGETWVFLVTDFVAPGPPPTYPIPSFDSLGIPPRSAGSPPSTASIVILADHFKVYDVEDIPLTIPVVLQDQFRPSGYSTMVEKLDFFANPVDKGGEGISDYGQHQKWYRLAPVDGNVVRVEFRNQFGKQVWRVQNPEYLVVPSNKNASPGPGTCTAGNVGLPCAMHSDCDTTLPPDGICGGLRHYLCYNWVSWFPYTSSFDLELCDQFSVIIQEPTSGGNGIADTAAIGDDIQVVPVGALVAPGDVIIRTGPNGEIDSTPVFDDVFGLECEQVMTRRPRYWCNPVQKRVDGAVYPIEPEPGDLEELAHLACYDLYPKVDHPDLVVSTLDQMNEDLVNIRTNELLCVPSEKDAVAVPTMGRWGFAALVAVLMLATALFVGYRRRALTAGSAG